MGVSSINSHLDRDTRRKEEEKHKIKCTGIVQGTYNPTTVFYMYELLSIKISNNIRRG